MGSSVQINCTLHPRSVQKKRTVIITVIKCVDLGVGKNLRLLVIWLPHDYFCEPVSKLRRVISTLQSCKDYLL